MTIYQQIKYSEGRRFRCYTANNNLSWLPYQTPDIIAAFELPSNEIEERFTISEYLGIPLKQIKFKWKQE
jgi:hypothetical protein